MKMVEFGPIQLIAIGFPEIDNLKGDLLKELFSLSQEGLIRVIGLSGIIKDEKGNVAIAKITQLPEEERIKLGAVVGALIGLGAGGKEGAAAGAEVGAQMAAMKDFGLSKKELLTIAKDMPNGTAAGIMLVEHLWAKKLKEIAIRQKGIVMANGFISPLELVYLGAQLAEGAKAAEKIRLG